MLRVSLLALALALPLAAGPKVGLVTDVGGRGDQSFNDSALRGLEMWAAGKKYDQSGYVDLSEADRTATIPACFKELGIDVKPLGVEPVVLVSRAQEDYTPNIQTLVDEGCELVIGVGFMLENAIEQAAKENPKVKFMLIDSPILDDKRQVVLYPNVETYTFMEHEGSFLVGAIAGLVTKSGKVGFVGGMEMDLIKKFEAGYRAGVRTTNPKAEVLVAYTGSFDSSTEGLKAGKDQVQKGADVIYQAAGVCGLGVIDAAKQGKVWAIGVDSDQAHVAPGTVLTSMVKHVDLVVYRSIEHLVRETFEGGNVVLGLKDGGLEYAPLPADLPNREAIIATVDALREKVLEGKIKVPSTREELGK